MLMHTNAEQGALTNIAVGVIGAVIGRWIMSVIGKSGVGGLNLYSFLVALLGACVLIIILKMIRR